MRLLSELGVGIFYDKTRISGNAITSVCLHIYPTSFVPYMYTLLFLVRYGSIAYSWLKCLNYV